jgi:hypothetical protein
MANALSQQNGDLEHLDTHFDPGDADAVSHAALNAGAGFDDDQGQRVGRIITTKDYLDGRDANSIIAGDRPGTRIILGRLRGVVNSTERKKTVYKDKELESVWLNGEFEAVLIETGEVKAAPTAILPKAFGITIENALAGLTPEEKAELTIECDIGLEATGRPIPYEWVVIYYREGRAQKAMREVRARQEARIARQARKALPSS